MGKWFDLSSENVLALWIYNFLEHIRTNEFCFLGGGGGSSEDPSSGITVLNLDCSEVLDKGCFGEVEMR